MIDDLFGRGEPLNLLDDHYSDESTLAGAAERQPSEDSSMKIVGGPSTVVSEFQGFNTDVAEDLGGCDLPSSNHQTRASENEVSRLSENLKPKPSNRDFVSRGLGVIAAVLLAVGGLFTARDLATSQPQQLVAAVEAPAKAETPRYLSKDIRDLQVMQDRVLADNPLEDETESPLGEIVPAEWRVVRLEHTEPNGTRHLIERGVPLEEVEGNAGLLVVEGLDRVAGELDVSSESFAEPTLEPIRVGQTIFIDLPEHGISADFLVKEIRSCPTPNSGDGYLVTTKFIHENAEILDLRIEGSVDVIGTTASHRFWSEDRQQFVAAGDLRVGENLLLADDSPRKVESLTRRISRETVYNIEVDGEHVFYVGNDGVLVHNECAGWHHFFARYLGSKVPYGSKLLNFLSKAEHTHLHSALRKWMKQNYPDLMYGPGRGRAHMVGTYTLRSRMKALREFYGQYRNPKSAKDFKSLFEQELKDSLARGLIE
jgi:hypothetical protein